VDTLAKELTATLADELPIAAYLLDWLRVVHGFDTEGYCYQAPDEVPHDWQRSLDELRDLPTPPSAVERVSRGRRLKSLNEAFQFLYSHKDHSYGFAGERASWKVVQDAYAEFRASIQGNALLTPPELDDEDVDRAMAEGDIAPGSQRARHFKRLVAELHGSAVDLHQAKQNAYQVQNQHGPAPSGATGQALEAAWDVALGTQDAEAALKALSPLLERFRAQDVVQIARVTEPWFQENEWDHRLLRPVWERRRKLVEQVQELERQGVEAEIVSLSLEQDDLEGAEGFLAELKENFKETARSRQVQGSLGRATEIVDRLAERGSFPARLDELRRRAGELSVLEVREVEREATLALRDEQVAKADEWLDGLGALGALGANGANGANGVLDSASALVEKWRKRGNYVAEEELDTLRNQVNEATAAERDALRSRLDTSRKVLENLRGVVVEDAWRPLNERLTTIEVEFGEDELGHARMLLNELEAEILRHRTLRWDPSDGEAVLVQHILDFVSRRASFDPYDVRRLHVALKAKRFAVLAGLTGTGKSTLAREYAAALGADRASGRFRRIAVRPNWVDASEVLGYVNPLTSRFEPGWLATVIRDCQRAPDLPMFVLLDEMNLAPVEHYLSDALAAMEESVDERPTVTLHHSGTTVENEDLWPEELPFPRNLFLIGTVNIDESTRPLTDRVLDRTSLIQLRTTVDDRHHEARERERSVAPLDVRMTDLARIRTDRPDNSVHRQLVALGDTMGLMGIGLGARNHIEIERLIANSADVLERADAIDAALLQRVVPRIRGYRRDLSSHLSELLEQTERLAARRTSRVLKYWIEELGEHGYIDGTSALVGIVTHR